MDRRTFLGRGTVVAAAALGGSVGLVGCLGRGEERFTLQIAQADFGENDAGYLEAWVTVTNVGNERQTGTLYVDSKLNDEPLTRVREVDLDAHQTEEYTVTYDIRWEQVRNFSLDPELEPPAD